MDDKLIEKAIDIAKENQEKFCLSLLQRKLKIGCIKSSKLIDILEERGIISAYNSQKNIREVLVK